MIKEVSNGGFKVIINDFCDTLITLYEDNASLRKGYKDMITVKQLKKEN